MPLFSNDTIVKMATIIDTARFATYMTESEKDMIKEINIIRSNPKGYIPTVQAYIEKKEAEKKNSMFDSSWFQDEIDTAHELIAELKNTLPCSMLEPNEKVHIAAQKHGDEGKAKGSLTHQGADDSWPWDRIKKEDAQLQNGGENLVGGVDNVSDSVMALLVDSGIPGRGHRKNILNPSWKYVACYHVGQVSDMPDYWVQLFAAPVQQADSVTNSNGGNSGLSKADLATGGANAPAAPVMEGDISKNDLDTAQNEAYLTDREKAMMKEINLIRSNPTGYVSIVEAYIQKQEGELASVVSGKEWIKDHIETCHELIAELKITPRLSILKPHEGIFKAAKLHGEEGKAKGSLNHQGSDGSWPWDRVLRQAPELNDGNENLVGGPLDIRESIMLLLVDSGIPNRGHRKTLLNPGWLYCACYEIGQVGNIPNYWVQNYGM